VTAATQDEVSEALIELEDRDGGVQLKHVADGWTLATDPIAEDAARRLLARPRTPPLTPAQAETLAIVAYLQPVSRPEITRIRGVAAESAAATLLERGLIEESGRSQFGAILYRTTSLFLKLFGLTGLDALPDVTEWEPDARRGGRPTRAPAQGRRRAQPGHAGAGLMLLLVTVRARDLEASMRFYFTVLAPIGGGAGDLAVEAATPVRPPTQRLHIGFYVPTTELVHAFWDTGIAAGYRDDGAPGPRAVYKDDYYGGFLLDPDGNSVEAMTHQADRVNGQIDHLWIRVADVGAAREEHRTACERAGYALTYDAPERVQFKSTGASVSFVEGPPTEHVEIALGGGPVLSL